MWRHEGRTDHLVVWHRRDIFQQNPSRYYMKYLNNHLKTIIHGHFWNGTQFEIVIRLSDIDSVIITPDSKYFDYIHLKPANLCLKLSSAANSSFHSLQSASSSIYLAVFPSDRALAVCCRFMVRSNMHSIGKALNMSSLNTVSSLHR